VLELAPEVEGLQTLLAPAVAYAVLSGIERGSDLEALSAVAFDTRLDKAAATLPYTQLSWARAELCLTQEKWSDALRGFQECVRPEPGYGTGNPAMVPWREGTAIALMHMGDRTQAQAVAEEAVHRSRQFGAPRATGVALRAAALVADADDRLRGLREAVSVLERARSPLELARARCDLGAALRAAGNRTEAQAVLAAAHDLAQTLGASRIARRAEDELRAAGVRPRRDLGVGPASLTPSERRIAELAAAGKTNREIAQALFVTEKTVETHLGHVYDKLGVRSRRKLPEMLGLLAA
jgi:DNA-binding CsgD family transcriptional regulator